MALEHAAANVPGTLEGRDPEYLHQLRVGMRRLRAALNVFRGTLREAEVRALRGVNLVVNPGAYVAIMGPSGSGKTTLLSIMGCLMRPTAGEVLVRGTDVVGLRERDLPAIRAGTFGFIFQGFNLFPALTALENVTVTIRMKNPRAKGVDAEARRLLDLVGLGDRLHHLPADLSGGQKQRVAIARALACSPPVILGDEPTAALDTKTGLAVMELLQRLARDEGRAVVVVTHDPRLERFADRVVRVEDGEVREGDEEVAA